MIEDWSFVEADFLREYGLDLSTDLAGMTWRRFLVLLRGLSPNAATVTALHSRVQFGRSSEKVNEVSTPEQAQSVFETLYRRLA